MIMNVGATARITKALTVALLASIALAGAARGDSGCDPAVPNPGPDQVLTNLRSWEVDAFYRTLWALRTYYYNHNRTGWRRKLDNMSGQYIDTRTAVKSCTNLGGNNAWTNSWICLSDVTGTFKLKNKIEDRLRADGGGVTTIHEADGDAVQFTQSVGYLWDAPSQSLTVYVRYPASTVAQNHQRTWGTYSMTALSRTRVRSSASEGSSGLTLNPFGVSLGASKTEDTVDSIVRATVTGNPYWADTGIVVYRRDFDADSYLALENHWLTNAYANLTTRVDQNTAECGTSSKFTADLKAYGLVDSSQFGSGLSFGPNTQGSNAAIQFAGTDSTTCSASSEPFVAQLTFIAANGFGECCNPDQFGATGNSVGQRFVAKLHAVNHLDGKCRRSYEVGFVARVNWYLRFRAGSGDETLDFDIPSESAAPAPPEDFGATVNCI